MTMSVQARQNIGGTPFAGVFRPGGLVFYRTSNSDLRKADMDGAVDALFANTLGIGGAAAVVNTALYAGGYYCSAQTCANGGGPFNLPKMNFVNLATGVVTIVNLLEPVAFQILSSTLGAIGNKICCAYTGGGTPKQAWSLLPPAAGLVSDDSTGPLITGASIYTWGRWNNGLTLLMNSSVGGNNLRAGSFTVRPPANLAASALTPPLTDGLYTPILYSDSGSGHPWSGWEYNGYTYICGEATSLGLTYPALVRFNNATGVAQVQILDTVNACLGTNTIMNFWIDQTFGRIYWSFGAFSFRVYGATLGPWPLMTIDTVDVDTGNNALNSVTGVFTDPPYVYVIKSAGPTYGNQHIRIYDTALETAKRSKRRGGELWDLIPEVAPYISP